MSVSGSFGQPGQYIKKLEADYEQLLSAVFHVFEVRFFLFFKPEVPALGLLYPPLSVRPKLNTYLHNAQGRIR